MDEISESLEIAEKQKPLITRAKGLVKKLNDSIQKSQNATALGTEIKQEEKFTTLDFMQNIATSEVMNRLDEDFFNSIKPGSMKWLPPDVLKKYPSMKLPSNDSIQIRKIDENIRRMEEMQKVR